MSVSKRGALSNVLIIELGTMITAPLAAMMLADMGAKVIKIENPNGGDPFRHTIGGDYGPNFIAYNHNKRSLKLDLTTPSGKAILEKLIAKADVVLENYRPGVMEKLGFSNARIVELNPKIIHCSITGFGTSGPYKNRPAYDTVGVALSGIASLMLEPERPELMGPTMADNVTGMYACTGILAALHARQETGEAQRVEVNMLESAISLIPDPHAYYTQLNVVYSPTSRVAASHCYAFRCSDDKLITVHLSVPEKFWQNCLGAMDAQATLGADERFNSRKNRIDNYPALYKALLEVIETKPRAYWEQRFTESDVPFAPVNRINDVQDDPQVRHMGTFQKINHPKYGDLTALRSPIWINGSRLDIEPPPDTGEHSSCILEELGYSPEQINEMKEKSII